VLTAGVEDTFSVTVTNKGVGVALNDYVDSLKDLGGYFDERKAGDDLITKSYDKRIADIQDRLERKKLSLEKKYAALETAMAKLQSQSSALSSAIAKLNASTPAA
jgi:flagellar capping protein FliD